MDNKEYELKFKYAWNWFKYHAVQRYSSFYYYLIIIGALAYGYIQGNCAPRIKLIISLFGVIVSLAFIFIEKRNADLVDCGRLALDALEKDKKCVLSTSYIRCRDRKSSCGGKKGNVEWIRTHTFWFRAIICTVFTISLFAMVDIIVNNWGKIMSNIVNPLNWIILIVTLVGFIVFVIIACSSLKRVVNIKIPDDCWNGDCK
ncbi:MAG: hypothetical protein WCW67_08395 [Candidatus Margulisiibacteriota bacterium]|jgi:hypothetical protein